ncbi:uncharacterized protein LOC117340169 [Pecten maximus]|uniref:uncharacterized protein LOC117340169 n=1 Tax=Pecten maximus TaxID=6579 RepID=UPI0014588331|nr:uncharacterized protein LOC117340169 [Pecten maximus]
MITAQFLLVFFSVGFAVAVVPTDISGLTYDCLPDGIIHIHGVPKGYTITSLLGGSSCHVTQIDTHDYALGRSCTQWTYHSYPDYTYMYQADVQLSHSSSHVVGGSGFSPFRLICDKVHSGGQVFKVRDIITVRDRSIYSSALPTLAYARKLENNRRYYNSPQMSFSRSQYSTQNIYSDIYSGNLIYLHIRSGDSHYAVRPENCTAKDKNSYYGYHGESVELWDVTQDRCVLEPYLMNKFSSMDADQTVVTAPVYAFHFGNYPSSYYSQGVFFECSVRVCSRGSFSCTLDVCDDVRREGRSAEEEDGDDYDRHLISATLTIRQSGSVRERFSLTTTLLGGLAVIFCRKRISM